MTTNKKSEVDIYKSAENITSDNQSSSSHTSYTVLDKIELARHQMRPRLSDYIDALCGDDFVELSGDRYFGDDKAITCGLGRIENNKCVIIGHEKGKDLKTRRIVNFGCARPEGYRKASRIIKLADQLKLPIITFVDTSGADPGVKSEERGQACALAECMSILFKVEVPVLTIIHGEGGSGGAVAIAIANRLLMLEHAIYSVISPEGCAQILWRDIEKRAEAAESQKITAQDLKAYKLIDDIIQEPPGGAHMDYNSTFANVRAEIIHFFDYIRRNPDFDYMKDRIQRYYRQYT